MKFRAGRTRACILVAGEVRSRGPMEFVNFATRSRSRCELWPSIAFIVNCTRHEALSLSPSPLRGKRGLAGATGDRTLPATNASPEGLNQPLFTRSADSVAPLPPLLHPPHFLSSRAERREERAYTARRSLGKTPPESSNSAIALQEEINAPRRDTKKTSNATSGRRKLANPDLAA